MRWVSLPLDRVGVLGPVPEVLANLIREVGGEPWQIELPSMPLIYGPALRREWISDQVQVRYAAQHPSALLLHGGADPHELPAFFLAAMRLDLPIVVANFRYWSPFGVALAAAGFAPFRADTDTLAAPRLAVELLRSGRPRPRDLLNGFSLANALRAGLAAGGGPELLVHLAAVAREAGEVGFSRMIRVLAPESPALQGYSRTADLLASLGDALHDVRTVEGKMLKESLPDPPETKPVEKDRLHFVSGRTSGVEAVAQAPPGVQEVAGECRVFGSEDEAIRGVAEGQVGKDDLLIVAGCGVRGVPGLLRLAFLSEALAQAELDVPVVTDGLPAHNASGTAPRISLFTPEAADGSVIGRLRDGDFLRFDLAEGRIRTSVTANELANREPFAKPDRAGYGYAARYAASALSPLEGAGFG